MSGCHVPLKAERKTTTEYKVQTRYDGGYEGKWQDSLSRKVYRDEGGLAEALRNVRTARDEAKHTLWEYRIVSRTVTEWTEVTDAHA